MAAKKDDPKPGSKSMDTSLMPQHKRMASGQPIPQGGGKGVTTK